MRIVVHTRAVYEYACRGELLGEKKVWRKEEEEGEEEERKGGERET